MQQGLESGNSKRTYLSQKVVPESTKYFIHKARLTTKKKKKEKTYCLMNIMSNVYFCP